jgi:hypothetical protein
MLGHEGRRLVSPRLDDDPRRLGFHNPRHSLASFLIRIRTDPKTVQTLLRDSDVKLTLQFYTHAVSRDRMVAAGKMLTAILSHAPGKNGLTSASVFLSAFQLRTRASKTAGKFVRLVFFLASSPHTQCRSRSVPSLPP